MVDGFRQSFNWAGGIGGQSMSVKVSPISRFVSLLIIAIGIFTLLVGWATGILEDSVAGIAFIILGIVLYRLPYRFERKV